MNALPQRKRTRLHQYDYNTSGCYFLTICTQEKQKTLCTICPDDFRCALTPIGSAVREQIGELDRHVPNLHIEAFVIMPNHVHLLISAARSPADHTPLPLAAARIPSLISAFKRFTNRKCSAKLWQRGYYDHIVRDEDDYLRILQYINENPAKWASDEYYSD